MKVTQLLHRRNKTKATVSKVSTTKRSLEDTIASSSDDDDEDNSRLSSLSDSTTDDLTSVGEDSEDMERFERSLRQKHAKACKAMAVRTKHEAGASLAIMAIMQPEDLSNTQAFPFCSMTERRIRPSLARV
jgi:hypothetical protein